MGDQDQDGNIVLVKMSHGGRINCAAAAAVG